MLRHAQRGVLDRAGLVGQRAAEQRPKVLGEDLVRAIGVGRVRPIDGRIRDAAKRAIASPVGGVRIGHARVLDDVSQLVDELRVLIGRRQPEHPRREEHEMRTGHRVEPIAPRITIGTLIFPLDE